MNIRQKSGAEKVFRNGGEHVSPEVYVINDFAPDFRKKMLAIRQGENTIVLSKETIESIVTWVELRTP